MSPRTTHFGGAILVLILGTTACTPADETAAATDQAQMEEAAPAVDATSLIALEEAVWEDLAAGDWEAMRARMADDIIFGGSHGFVVGADTWLAQTAGGSCEMESWSIDPPRVTMLSPGSALLTYRTRARMGCDGQAMSEAEGFSTTIWVLRDGEWKMAYYSSVEAE